LKKKKKEEESKINDGRIVEDNSSAVSDDTCCTCRESYTGDFKLAKCAGIKRIHKYFLIFRNNRIQNEVENCSTFSN
jgi:hypothetical protein